MAATSEDLDIISALNAMISKPSAPRAARPVVTQAHPRTVEPPKTRIEKPKPRKKKFSHTAGLDANALKRGVALGNHSYEDRCLPIEMIERSIEAGILVRLARSMFYREWLDATWTGNPEALERARQNLYSLLRQMRELSEIKSELSAQEKLLDQENPATPAPAVIAETPDQEAEPLTASLGLSWPRPGRK